MFEEQTPEASCGHGDRQEETGAAGNPTLAVWGDAATQHNPMQMKVCPQLWSTARKPISAPRCWESAAMVRRVPGGAEENAVNHLFVLIGEGGDLCRHGKGDMEILDRQQLGLEVLEPLGTSQRLTFGTKTISPGVVSRALVAAGVTLLQMATQGGSPAEFDALIALLPA